MLPPWFTHPSRGEPYALGERPAVTGSPVVAYTPPKRASVRAPGCIRYASPAVLHHPTALCKREEESYLFPSIAFHTLLLYTTACPLSRAKNKNPLVKNAFYTSAGIAFSLWKFNRYKKYHTCLFLHEYCAILQLIYNKIYDTINLY